MFWQIFLQSLGLIIAIVVAGRIIAALARRSGRSRDQNRER